MDSLSVIASIAGISATGISLSQAIYDAILAGRNAPKEASAIAQGLYDVSFALRELRRVLNDNEDVYRRKLIRRLASVITRVDRVQGEIKELLDGPGSLAKLGRLRESKAMGLPYAIESHKAGINVILQTTMLAVQLKQLSRENERTRVTNGPSESEDDLNDVVLARQQAENMVQILSHTLRELASERLILSSPPDTDDENGGDSQAQRIRLRNPQCLDDAVWLCDLIFSTAIEATAESTESEPDQESHPGGPSVHTPRENLENSPANSPSSQALGIHSELSLARLRALTQHPREASTVVNELLSEWTTLTEDEIEGIGIVKQHGNNPNHTVQMVDFKDSVGRKYELPFELIREWAGIEKLIQQMFLHFDAIGPHIQAGHYDLVNSRGNIVLPSLWKYSIKPTDSYTMHMWPMKDLKRLSVGNPTAGEPPARPPSTARPPPSPPPAGPDPPNAGNHSQGRVRASDGGNRT
ncbi:hypothetical protein F5X98DRAFT_379239 [Xylaria grammica]|nr:hypothetical protein F5X98DRAFT_379239 [Xylaria grammica]